MSLPILGVQQGASPAKSNMKQSNIANRNALGYSSVKQMVTGPKLLNYKHINLVKVHENRFVSQAVNVNSFDAKKSAEAFNFTEKRSGLHALEQRSLSFSNINKKKLSEASSPSQLRAKNVSRYGENNRNLTHALTTESSGQAMHPYLESRGKSSTNVHSNFYQQRQPSTSLAGSALLLRGPPDDQRRHLSDMNSRMASDHRMQ